MLQRYRSEVRAKLLAEFGYKNEMQIPKLDKIVVNMGIGEAVADSKKAADEKAKADAEKQKEAGDKAKAAWLPDEATARRWQEFWTP